MILLLSDDQFQTSIDEVILWLSHYNAKFIRLNSFDYSELSELNIDFSNDLVQLNNKLIDFNNINVVWNFRFGKKSETEITISAVEKMKGSENTILNHLGKSNDILSQYFFSKLKSKPWFNFPVHSNCIKYKQESNAAYKAAIIQKNYPKALKVLKKLESKYEVLKQEEYMLQAYCFKSNNQNTEVAKSLRKAWSNYGQDGNYIYSILELSPLKLMQGFDSIQKAIVNEGYNNFAKLKKPIFDTIDKLFTIIDIRDQEIRSLFLDTTIIYTKTEIDSLSKIQLVLDSLNMADFKEYVLRHGFPGELAFPGNALMGFPFLIHTGDNANFVRDMNPIFLEELRKGNMPPSFYLSWRDRVQLHNKLPSKFGMFDIQEVRLLTKKQLKKIGKQRLKYGLVEVYPIPDKVLNFK